MIAFPLATGSLAPNFPSGPGHARRYTVWRSQLSPFAAADVKQNKQILAANKYQQLISNENKRELRPTISKFRVDLGISGASSNLR